ncbi:hypothetical protein J6A31_04595 [bacterium]|nr:hypothetical protein [bacterium]
MKSSIKTILMLAIGVTACLFCLTGCKPYDVPEFITIEASQTAFLIPLTGDTSDQAAFASEELLEQHKVATKEIQIPHRWVQTGRMDIEGEWRASAKLIVVDRAPVTREWVSGTDAATSQGTAIFGESLDGIGVYVGMNCSAQIDEANATKFLYRYNNTPLATVIDTDIRAMVEDEFNKAVGKYNIADLQANKTDIMTNVVSNVKAHFAEYGVTITVLGMKEGISYENPAIQTAIDEKFSSEQLLTTQQNLNEVEIAKAEAAAEAAKIKAEADAEVLLIAAEAEAEANKKVADSLTEALVELRKIEKWDGVLPQVQGDGTTIVDISE